MTELIDEVLEKFNYKQIATKLGLANGTVKTWITKKKVPKIYTIDLMKLISKDIDYTQYTSKEKDQFFTPYNTALHCHDVFCQKMKELNISTDEYTFIEPSAGDGAFLNILPKDRTIALDIEPRHENIQKQDFLSWKPKNKNKKYCGFGNPPFGLRGNLALRFINHFSKFADFVCFILPPLFESDGKGSPRKRVKGYNLIHSEKLNSSFYEPEDKDTMIKINCIFQIWAKNIKDEKYEIQEIKNEHIKIYSLSTGNSPSQKRNIHMIDCCDIYLPSTCFGSENIKLYNSFEELPNKRGFGLTISKEFNYKKQLMEIASKVNWLDKSFLATNSSYNLRTSLIMKEIQQIYDKLN